MVAQQDLSAIVTMLGLTDVKAMGVSSVPDGSGFFRNRVFVYTGGERHGCFHRRNTEDEPRPNRFGHLGSSSVFLL
jgi:hypothetical protein